MANNRLPPSEDCPLIALQVGTHGRDDYVVLRAMMDRAREYGYQCLDLGLTYNCVPQDIHPVGAIINELPDSRIACQLRDLGCPTVRLGSYPHPMDDQVPPVLPDLEAIGEMAAEHLASKEFKDVAYAGVTPWGQGKPAYTAFRRRAEELRCSCHLLQLPGTPFRLQHDRNLIHAWRFNELREWIATVPRPLGIYCHTQAMAGRVCMLCRSMGIAVPESVAILGYGNNLAHCEASPVPLSSIEPDHAQRGTAAMTLLRELIDGGSRNAPVLVKPTTVVERLSTDILAVPDITVSKAIRFIWDHLSWPVTVDDVALETGVSRSTLERRFRRHLGRGVKAELLRKRLEHAAKLLRSTDVPIKEIGAAIGLRSKRYFHKAFLRTYGITPGQFRRDAG